MDGKPLFEFVLDLPGVKFTQDQMERVSRMTPENFRKFKHIVELRRDSGLVLFDIDDAIRRAREA